MIKFSWSRFVNLYLSWLPWNVKYYLQAGYRKPVCWIFGHKYIFTIPLCDRCNSFKKNDPTNPFTNGVFTNFLVERYAGNNPKNKPGQDGFIEFEKREEIL